MARILIATDDTETAQLLTVSAGALGHETRVALNGLEAVEVALDWQPDLIFLSESLRVYNGFELCAILRADPQISREIPILLVTSSEPDAKTLELAGLTDRLAPDSLGVEMRETLSRFLPRHLAV